MMLHKQMKRTIGGDRIGAGKKMQVDLPGYGRSTFDLSHVVRTTMSAGTLVPFLKKVALPGDTWDIDLDVDIQTHPTIGPLFGSFKVQIDIYAVPWRLYNSRIHNNAVGVGLNMDTVYIPVIEYEVPQIDAAQEAADKDMDNYYVNPSCIMRYLGWAGPGINENDVVPAPIEVNAIPLLGYWDIVKNYYANKQEEVGYVINYGVSAGGAITEIRINGNGLPDPAGLDLSGGQDVIVIDGASATEPNLNYILFNTSAGEISAANIGVSWAWQGGGTNDWEGRYNAGRWGQITVYSWRTAGAGDSIEVEPTLLEFELNRIDEMREEILAFRSSTAPMVINGLGFPPYDTVTELGSLKYSQQGLAVKTYQSDLFNNWVKTEYIDGPDGINELTAISTVGNKFTINQLIISKKIYEVMNRVAISGGTYKDWAETVYDEEMAWIPEIPVYEGGLIKELVFQEVVSNSQSETQPLGTLGGRGVLNSKHKGGKVIIKVKEISYIMGIISLTPRIGYSQGNDWDMYALKTWDNLHKPGLDGIGFEDSIDEQRAWWSTQWDGNWDRTSAGKLPAWINYMTAVNKHYGNFAIENNEQFMVLDRKYEWVYAAGGLRIKDLTTYIDPAKFNNIFAQTSLDAQNFWVNIGMGIEKRAKMSSRIMPNL